MDIRDLSGKTVVVTGAGSGIGRQAALAFARRHARLALCDVNESGLAETARLATALGCEVLTRRVDVARRDDMRAFAADVHQHVEAADIIMNNAGVGLGAAFLDTDLDDWDWIVGINFWGVVHGCHFFLPPMVACGRGGHLINVSSTAGYVATETLCAYSTTKFAVLGLSEALREELRRSHIGVTTVCPGVINTPITGSARMKGFAALPAARQRVQEFYQRRNYTPERVAANILRAVQRNRAVAPISSEAWMMYYLKRLAPGFVAWMNRQVAERLRREVAARES
jgi:NAD(P)-dependent dehydrogenase (short-subunit alcohol dehydrogenase family)